MLRTGLVAITAAAVGLPTLASAHVERPSYWPDPAPDRTVKPATGGKVPKARSLASALEDEAAGQDARRLPAELDDAAARRRSRRARKSGYEIRPTDQRKLSRSRRGRLLRINRRLRKLCQFREIQPAVTASRNNDRVVIMPGPLHRADVAREADERPGVRRVPHQRRQARRGGHRALVRVPVQLPERPEPRRGHRPRGRRGEAADPAAREPPRDPRPRARASAATSRSRARASTPTT